MTTLANRTAIVTGAGSGIGRAVALAYARAGANVVASDIDDRSGIETASLAGSNALFVRADAANADDHERLVRAAVERFGALHIACNNAGIGGEVNPVAEMTLEGWQRVIDINLSGVFYAMRAQIPRMLEAGGGSIVNIASIYGAAGAKNAAGYVAAKHGVVGLTKTAALEYGAHGIRVNAAGPSYTDTPMLNRLPEERRTSVAALHALGRIANAEEVAALVLWLSSDAAAFVTGSFYPVDGGYLAR